MSRQTNDGGPAFPVQDEGEWLDPKTCTQWEPFNGMTLRDYFAGQALMGLCANPGGPIQANGMTGWGFTNCDAQDVAHVANSLADAMLAARERKEDA